MRIGEVFRYAADKDPGPASIDGLPNFWHVTSSPGQTRAQLEKGINPIKPLSSPNDRVPAILIGSSPHKRGSDVTPWEDQFDVDVGRVRYFGDSKVSKPAAPNTPGNKALLGAFALQSSTSREERAAAPPLILFRRVARHGRVKGFVEFQGVGIVESASLVTQIDPKSGVSFSNYVFDIAVVDKSAEAESFNWDWISARRDPSVKHVDALKLAPAAWRKYVEKGPTSISRVRRSAAASRVASKEEQLPSSGSKEERALSEVMGFYATQKHRFEAVAEVIASRVLGGSTGQGYKVGWVSQRGGDGGRDFVGRLDIGGGFAGAHLVVLGQAKCEQSATSGRDIARTVARLRRGWVGCYVTTSYFSKPVQTEIVDDKYPLVLVHGLRVAEELLALQLETGATSVTQVLQEVDATYESRLSDRDPEQVLHF